MEIVRPAADRMEPTATLSCGRILQFEFASCLPGPGDLVPCVRHGYCRTESIARGRGAGPRRPRPPRRTETELVQWLAERPTTTLGVLRRHRFPLRLVIEAQRSGRVEVDVDSGRVTAVGRT